MATLLQDSFADSNGTALSSHTMNVGPGWTLLSGGFTIQSNHAEGNAPGSNNQWAISDAGNADVVITLDVGGFTGSVLLLAEILVRASDINNLWRCILENDISGSYLTIFEIVAGVQTLRAGAHQATNLGSGTSTTLTVTASGNSITIATSQGDSLTYASASSNNTVTKHGIGEFMGSSYNAAGPTTLDNFLCTGTAPGGFKSAWAVNRNSVI